MCIRDREGLRTLKDQVAAELVRAKLSADPLLLRQREGFLSANLAGYNAFGPQYERVLPAGSVANLYPCNYSGNLQLNRWEYGLVNNAVAHECLYKCGNDRFLLVVDAPGYKAERFGKAGGK